MDKFYFIFRAKSFRCGFYYGTMQELESALGEIGAVVTGEEVCHFERIGLVFDKRIATKMKVFGKDEKTYDEIVDDYLITYDNYYQKTPEKDASVCNALVSLRLNTCLMYYASVSDEAQLKNIDYAAAFSDYLTSHGMSRQQVDALVQALK